MCPYVPHPQESPSDSLRDEDGRDLFGGSGAFVRGPSQRFANTGARPSLSITRNATLARRRRHMSAACVAIEEDLQLSFVNVRGGVGALFEGYGTCLMLAWQRKRT